MRRVLYGLVLPGLVFIAGCKGNDKKVEGSRDVSPGSIYFDYKISADEESDSITVLLHYRYGRKTGPSLLLEDPEQVSFDGQPLTADSSPIGGAFYEARAAAAGFEGPHRIVFTDRNGRQHEEIFEFRPLTLTQPLPDSIERSDLVLELAGFEKGNLLHVLLTDTSRYSDGISREDTAGTGPVVITRDELDALAAGPVFLELLREQQVPVKNGTARGGTLTISYALRREFILK